MRIESLELFLSVAEHGSISRTAKQHFISQQGVSSALKALEKELGTPLFTRGGPKLELTERGRAIASEAQRIVDSHQRMLAIASAPKDATTQNLRTVEILTTPFASAALEELFLDYEATTPGTRLRVTERDLFRIVDDFAEGYPSARRATQQGRPPLAIICCMPGMDKTISRMNHEFEPLVNSELMAACSTSCALASKDSITRDELCKYPIVFYSEPFLNKVVGKLFNGLEPNIQQNTTNTSMLARAMERDGAVTFSDSFSSYLQRQHGSTAFIPIKDSVYFSIGFLGNVAPDTPEAQFANFLRKYLAIACAPYQERYVSLMGDAFGYNWNRSHP